MNISDNLFSSNRSAASLMEQRAERVRQNFNTNVKMARDALSDMTFEQALHVVAQHIEEHPGPNHVTLRRFAQNMDRLSDEIERSAGP